MTLPKGLWMSALLFLFSIEVALSQDVLINEIMASNSETIADEDGDYEDWIELYNAGNETVNLFGYGLSDDYDRPYRWLLPNISIAPGEFLLVWASGKDRTNPSQPLHTNFSISSSGEEILLTSTDGTRVDEIPPTAIPTDISYGRVPDGGDQFIFFENPTPGESNDDSGFETILSQPEFSVSGGFYSSDITLDLSSDDSEAIIYYTLDGSEPTTSSNRFQGSISVSSRAGDPNDISLIPTNNIGPGNPYSEEWVPPNGEIFKITTVRARAFREGAKASEIATHSYVIDPLGSDRYSMPVFSITTDRENLFDDEIGIYVYGNNSNYNQRGREWERPAHIEFFETDGSREFGINGGIRIHGGTSRNRPRKTLRIYTRGEYGTSWLEYPLFPDKDVQEYKRFLLRNSGNDWRKSLFRDAYMQRLLRDYTELDIQHTRPAIVFLNGEYWGIHNIRDRMDHHYIYSHYGIDEMEMTMMENNRLYDRGDPDGVAHFNAMYDFIANQSMASASNYEWVTTQMDVDNFIDYQVAQIYFRNTDWPGNNLAYWRYNVDYDPNARAPYDGRWRWIVFDVDFGFNLDYNYVQGHNQGAAHNTLAFATQTGHGGWPNPDWSTLLLRRLLTNTDFRNAFVNRFADKLNSNFSSEYANSILEGFENEYAPEMAEHILRWNQPESNSNWQNEIQKMRDFANQRPGFVRQHIQQHFSLPGTYHLTVQESVGGSGEVMVNSLKLDSQSPWMGVYFRTVPVSISAIPEEGYRFLRWEGDISGTNPEIEINPNSNISLRAVFEADDTPVNPFAPEPHRLVSGEYHFTSWSAFAEPGTYPSNMVFVYMDESDPGLNANIQGVAAGAYNIDSRTRINGLGDEGFSFINTGNSDGNPGFPGTRLGAVILALNTEGMESAQVAFTAGTISPNSRVYNWRLRYRLGAEGDFEDVLDASGNPVEYERNETPGHTQFIGPIDFPEEWMNQSTLQLKWRYYYTGDRLDSDSGQRTELQISEIRVTGEAMDDGIVLVSPENDAEGVSVQPEFNWSLPIGAERYQLQVAVDNSFFVRVVDEFVASTSYQMQESLETNTTYFWRVRAELSEEEWTPWSAVNRFTTTTSTSAEHEELPMELTLHQNYPNPFNPTTQIRYGLPEQSEVRLTVYNMLGQKVAILVNSQQNAGWHEITFDASHLSSGMYIYRLATNQSVKTNKMLLMK